jgi:hypothetical protein
MLCAESFLKPVYRILGKYHKEEVWEMKKSFFISAILASAFTLMLIWLGVGDGMVQMAQMWMGCKLCRP